MVTLWYVLIIMLGFIILEMFYSFGIIFSILICILEKIDIP